MPEAERELQAEVAAGATNAVAADAWITLAQIRKEMDHPLEAIDALEQAVAADPERKELYAEIARLYSVVGDRDKEVAALDRAEKAGTGDDASVLNLAINYLNENQYDRAEPIARRIIERGSADANLAVAHSVLARCDLSRGKTADGVAHLQKAISLDSTSKLAEENRSILTAMKK